MASAEPHTVYGQNDLDDDSEDDPQEDPDEDDTSSSCLAAGDVTVSGFRPGDPSAPADGVILALPYLKRERVEDVAVAAEEEKKPSAAAAVADDSRRLFQRLWTDEDEIELLRGFLEYTARRGGVNSSQQHQDTAAFYDQIRSKLQLDFNKNQLSDKLRRLKKKYRNASSKIDSGKEFVFKSPHDYTTFEISRKIWSVTGSVEFEDPNPNRNPTPTLNPNSFGHNSYAVDTNSPQKRFRGMKMEEKPQFCQPPHPTATPTDTSVSNLIEDTVRSCISPLFKELVHNASGSRGFGRSAVLNPMPIRSLNSMGGDTMDERWRKQQILELEVYSKRLALVQDQIKLELEELRSMGR
ncbi:Transcription factor [Actinidia chinensis var. chinensis]|uniref:Transcription factor n=1 Tax=Actinidia chinensis var. chinensis TaxID=1590841 RepID=A0A2R6RDU0_ACTCC|nr:Transcription factor [Actinidia chinensis var. chinensis]